MFFLVVLAFYRFLCLIKQKVFHGIIKLFHKWSVRWRGLVTGKLACKTLVSVSCNVCSCTKREAFLIHLNRSCNWILWQDQPHKQSGSRLRHVRLLVLPSWWWKVHHNECLTFTKHLGTKKSSIMHQSIPAAPSTPPPPGYCGAFARLVSPGGGAFANFALPGGRALANPGAIPELLTRTRFAIRK